MKSLYLFGCLAFILGCNSDYNGQLLTTDAAALMHLNWAYTNSLYKTNFVFSDYIKPTNGFYFETKNVILNGVQTKIRFGKTIDRLKGGRLVITDGGLVLWIYDCDGEIIENPQHRSIPRR